MTSATKEEKFLDDLDKKLWTAADKLRSNLDAAVPLCVNIDEQRRKGLCGE